MRAFGVSKGVTSKTREGRKGAAERGNYAADGQITKIETGKTRTTDDTGMSHAKNPMANTHSIHLPSVRHDPGASPSQRSTGFSGPDSRANPRMPQFALGGQIGAAKSALGRAKGYLRGASAGGSSGIDLPSFGKMSGAGASRGQGRAGNTEGERIRYAAADDHHIAEGGPGPSKAGRSASSGRTDVNPEQERHTVTQKTNFPFKGGVQGGAGRDRTGR